MRRMLLVAGAVASLAIATTGATTLVKLDFAELARQSDSVVIGTVADRWSEWDATGAFIHTNVTIEVERYVLGSGPATLTLRTPGGTLGGIGQVAHGAAAFANGERVLVFLTKWDDGTPKVLGYVQGKSTVFVAHDGVERLRGGNADGRTLQGVVDELVSGPAHAIPLRPARDRGEGR